MSVDADISTSLDLLGKTVEDLQTDISIGRNEITGELLHVTDYTGFSGDPELQVGNFLVIHSEVPDVDGVTITVEVVNGLFGPATLDEDGIAILRIMNNAQKVKIVASKEGFDSVTKTYSLTNLVLDES